MPYIGKSPSQAVRNRYYFTVASGATSVSGSDDNSNTLIFADGTYVDVYLNGVLLVADTDYNTTTANTIAGLSAMSANDVVEVIVYDVFSVFSGNVNSDFSVGGDATVAGTTSLTGKVGIGIATASEMLEVFNAASPAIQLNDGGDYKSILRLAGNDLEIRGSSGSMEFYTGNADGDSSTERVRIASSGQIGIGGANYGTSGQVLTSGGSGSAPSWADAGGGGAFSFISETILTGSTSTVDFLNLSTDFDVYYLFMKMWAHNSTATYHKINLMNGSTIDAESRYQYLYMSGNNNPSTATSQNAWWGDANLMDFGNYISQVHAQNIGDILEYKFYGLKETAYPSELVVQAQDGGGQGRPIFGAGAHESSSQGNTFDSHNGFRISAKGGTFGARSKLSLYGLKLS